MLCHSLLRHARSHGGRAMLLLALSATFPAAWQTAAAAEPAAITYAQAQQLALRNAPLLAARRAQTLAAREESARAAALPDPSLSVGIANLPVTGTDAFNAGADDMTMKQIGFSQTFPARAKREARQEVADRRIDQAQALSAAEQAAVQQSVAQAWIMLWATQRELDALYRLRGQFATAVGAAKARLAGGTGAATDALAVRAEALELDNRIDAAEATRATARAGLARWLQLPPEALQTGGEPPDLTTLPVAGAALLGAVDQQAALRPWQSRQAVAEAEVDAAIAEKRPDWTLGLSYGQRNRSPLGPERSDMLMLQVSVDLPLFTRNRQDRGIAARRADLDAVVAEREDARRTQTEVVRQRLAEWEGVKRQVARKEDLMLPLAHDRSTVALAAYAGGGDLQPWLQARRDEIELHVEHARHLAELGRDWAALAYLMPAEETQP